MIDFSRLQINRAKRCQLLTGSFEGNEFACPCKCAKACYFTKEQQLGLALHTEIKVAKNRNLLIFGELYAPTNNEEA